MPTDFFSRLILEWRSTYYLKPVLLIILMVTIFAFVKYYKKEGLRFAFLAYIVASFFLFTTLEIYRHFNLSTIWLSILIEGSNIVFQIVELIVFLSFYLLILKSKAIKNSLKYMVALFTILFASFIYEIISPNKSVSLIRDYSNLISASTYILIILGSSRYFYEFVNKSSETPPLKRPSFWIATGSFFYAIYSLPMVLIIEYMRDIDRDIFRYLTTVHYTLFCVFFISLIIALKCKRELTI